MSTQKRAFNKIILDALEQPENLSNADWDFVQGVAEMEDHQTLSPKQREWLENIEKKLD